MSDVTVKFAAQDDGVSSTLIKIRGSLENLEQSTKQASQSFDTSFKGMAIAGAAAGAAVAAGMKVIDLAADATRAVVDKMGEALDLGGELSDLSARTGESAGNLLILQRAFDNTGIGADKVGTAVNKLQKFITDASMGAEKQSAALARLGLSMTDLANMTPTEQMQVLADRISRIENPTERAAMAMQVFGKSGGELLPLLTNFSGEIANAKGELGTMPEIMDRSANAFDAISDKIGVVKGKVTEFAAGLLESAIPALSKFLNAGSELDAAKFGQILGQKLAQAFELITSGDIWDLFRLHAEKAINNIRTSPAMNNFAAFLNTVFDGITGGRDFKWDETFEKYKNAGIEANTEVNDAIDAQITDIWQKQEERAAAAAQAFESEMEEAAANSAIMLKDIPEVIPVSKEIPKWLERLPDSTDKANKDTASIKSNLEKGADAMSKAAAEVEKAMNLSDQIAQDIDQARKEDNIDKGGKERAKINEAIDRGDFQEAERRNNRLKTKELDQQIRGVDENGNSKDKRALREIAKEEGIETFRKNNQQLREEILKKREEAKQRDEAERQKKQAEDAKKRQEEMKPGKEGEKNQPKDNSGVLSTISAAVDAIRVAVISLEQKLPQPALGY
jgi:hypothetical protein